jgi:hypothetical protein
MALTKIVELGTVTVLGSGPLQVRTDTVIRDGDVEVTRTYHRVVYEPTRDLSTVPAGVLRRIARVVWTEAIVAAWEARPILLPNGELLPPRPPSREGGLDGRAISSDAED